MPNDQLKTTEPESATPKALAPANGSVARVQRLYDALKRIANYEPPERLRRNAGRDYGLDGDEAIEMAYENVIQEAKNAVRRMRRPKSEKPQNDGDKPPLP